MWARVCVQRWRVCVRGLKHCFRCSSARSGRQAVNGRVRAVVTRRTSIRPAKIVGTSSIAGCDVTKQMISSHEVSCGHRILACTVADCDQTLKQGELKRHIEGECKHVLVPCPSPGCDKQQVKRGFVSDHLLVCGHVMVACSSVGCDARMKRMEVGPHECVCAHFLLPCPRSCSQKVKRAYIEQHEKQDCPRTPMPCPFLDYGCEPNLTVLILHCCVLSLVCVSISSTRFGITTLS